MPKDIAIILNNGSLNSAVITALAAQKYRPVLLNVEITPQAGSHRRAAYMGQVTHFKPFREHTLPMPYLAMMESGVQVPQAKIDPRQSSSISSQLCDLVPMIAIAGRFAAYYHASAIYLGLRVGSQTDEIAQATEFVQIWNELLQLPCGQTQLNIQAPLLDMEPWQVVDVGYEVATPFEYTWSCREEIGDACGACSGCRMREIAFQQSGKPDPLLAEKKTV